MTEPVWRSRPGEPYVASPGTQRINDFIHLSEGLSNSFLLTTSDGNIVVNTGMGFEAPVHKANYEAISRAPLRYIVLTQGHVDHVGGVDHLAEEGTEIVATAANLEHQAYDARLGRFRAARSAFAFRERNREGIRRIVERFGPPPPQARPTPTLTFEEELTLELGGLRVELLAIPGAETNDSLVLWLPEHRICFSGNLFGCLFGHFPNLVTIRGDRYRDALTVAEAVARVRGLEPELLLPGHHQPIEGRELVRAELDRLHGAILHVHDEAVRGMNEGRDVYTLMRTVTLPPELDVGEGYGKVSWSVRAIWEHYAGWFHHRSSTELYAVPPSAVDEDWIELAGGVEAIVARARARLQRGEPVEALHLLDVPLSREEPGSEAVELAIEIHRRLEAESANFWLTAWLRHRIRELEARLAEHGTAPGAGAVESGTVHGGGTA